MVKVKHKCHFIQQKTPQTSPWQVNKMSISYVYIFFLNYFLWRVTGLYFSENQPGYYSLPEKILIYVYWMLLINLAY